MAPAWWLAVVGIDHYAEHEDSLDWPEKVGVHMTTLSEAQWLEAWVAAGFEAVETWRAAGILAPWSSLGDAPS